MTAKWPVPRPTENAALRSLDLRPALLHSTDELFTALVCVSTVGDRHGQQLFGLAIVRATVGLSRRADQWRAPPAMALADRPPPPAWAARPSRGGRAVTPARAPAAADGSPRRRKYFLAAPSVGLNGYLGGNMLSSAQVSPVRRQWCSPRSSRLPTWSRAAA
ncbi:hypothetical protein SAZ11_07005 [Streptomyces sp. FXJ1.4098]|nr:hypothetical protein [Streptomyces sp. FXJ1.4098]